MLLAHGPGEMTVYADRRSAAINYWNQSRTVYSIYTPLDLHSASRFVPADNATGVAGTGRALESWQSGCDTTQLSHDVPVCAPPDELCWRN